MGESDEVCDQLIEETRQEIFERAGEFYFGDGESFEQHHAIDELLRSRGETLMIVELGDAAPLGDWFASLGDSPAFRGGVSLAAADDLQHIVGGEDVRESRELMRQRFGADWLLLVDRYPSLKVAEDSPMSAVDVELVVISPESKTLATKTRMGGHPEILQQRIGKAAMAWLRKILTRAESES